MKNKCVICGKDVINRVTCKGECQSELRSINATKRRQKQGDIWGYGINIKRQG